MPHTHNPARLVTLIALMSICSVGAARAQPISLESKLTEQCLRWRVSETVAGADSRKPIGRLPETSCKEIAAKWLPSLAAMVEANDGRAVLSALSDICRDTAEKLAGRPISVVWCTTWDQRERGFVLDAPDDIWTALDVSPFEGIDNRASKRDRLLTEVFKRRLDKVWDQAQVETDLRSLGFARAKPTTAAPTTSSCSVSIGEIVGAPSKPLLLYGLQISISVQFAEGGQPPGWQQIQVKTGEAHL